MICRLNTVSWHYFCKFDTPSPGPFLAEDVGVNVFHEVASRGVGHHKAHMVCSLEAAMQVHQEGMLRSVDYFKDPLFAREAGTKVFVEFSVIYLIPPTSLEFFPLVCHYCTAMCVALEFLTCQLHHVSQCLLSSGL